MEAAVLTPVQGDKATDTEPLVLRVEQVAELLSCSKSQVYTLIRAGEIPSVRLGKSGVRVPKAQLIAWINSGGAAEEDYDRKRALIMAAKR